MVIGFLLFQMMHLLGNNIILNTTYLIKALPKTSKCISKSLDSMQYPPLPYLVTKAI